MSGAAVRVGVGTRLSYDGEVVEVVELVATTAGNEVVVKNAASQHLVRVSVRELLTSDRVRVIPDGPGPSADDPMETASVLLADLTDPERQQVRERAAHVREVLTGYRAGTAELAQEGEPRPEYGPDRPLYERYAAKAAETGVVLRTVQRWVRGFQEHCEAGLVPRKDLAANGPRQQVDQRWTETALEVMVEHTGESKPSRTMVIDRTNARVVARFGPDVVKSPSRATAFRVLEGLERRHPTFRLSTKRNRDIADRPDEVYGKLLSPGPDGEDYTAFVFRLPAQLSAHLHQQAHTLLRRLHIDEPVTWEPPIDRADTIAWPGPHPDDVHPEQLWALAREGLTRSAIATRLHTTPEHIHLAAVRHPQPWTRRHSSRPGTESPPTALPSEHELRAYVDQGLRPGQIARLTGCSHQRISKLLTRKGIGPPLPREVLRTLDPAWLREQYEDNHRSFADIAANLGIPTSDLSRHARKLGLAIRHGVTAHDHILADHGGPDAFSTTIWTAFATRGAQQRIRRLLAIPGHPTLNHAAKHLGIRKAILARQIDHIERVVGVPMLETGPHPNGIRLTSAGDKFAQDAVPVLAILDRVGNSDGAGIRRTTEEMPRV